MSDEILTPELAQGFNPYLRDPLYFEPPYPTIYSRVKLAMKHSIQAVAAKILIVDLSHWNGIIDVDAMIGSGVVAVIIKCSEGTTFKDPKFEEVWRAFHAAGIPIMLYHFFRDGKGSAEKSWFMTCADSFLQEVNGKTAVWLDVESDNGVTKDARANRAFGFCELIGDEGILAGMYSSRYFVELLFPLNDPRWDNVYQWNAHWTSLSEDTLPLGWSETMRMVWQFGIYPTHSWAPVIRGSQGSVDVNYGFWSSQQALREWLGEVVIPPPNGEHEHEELQIQIDALKIQIEGLADHNDAQDDLLAVGVVKDAELSQAIVEIREDVMINSNNINVLGGGIQEQGIKISDVEQIALANSVSIEKIKADLQMASVALKQGGDV